MAEILHFPDYTPEPLEPVSELIAAKPELWEKILAPKLGEKALDNIILSEN